MTAVMSVSLKVVSMAAVCRASTRREAITFRILDIGFLVSGLADAGLPDTGLLGAGGGLGASTFFGAGAGVLISSRNSGAIFRAPPSAAFAARAGLGLG